LLPSFLKRTSAAPKTCKTFVTANDDQKEMMACGRGPLDVKPHHVKLQNHELENIRRKFVFPPYQKIVNKSKSLLRRLGLAF